MPNRAPGVYIEEAAPPRQLPLQTGVPLFVGYGTTAHESASEQWDSNRCHILRFTNWAQFTESYRSDDAGGCLDYAVRGFFDNGGQTCCVALLGGKEPTLSPSHQAKKMVDLFEPFGPLENLEDVDLVCLPDIGWRPTADDRANPARIQQAALDYCRRMGDRLAILDAPPATINPPAAAGKGLPHDGFDAWRWTENFFNKNRPVEGALYFPWVYVKPLARHQHVMEVIKVPPCGHVAGIIARTDRAAGVHKPPANEIVEGVLDLAVNISNDEQAKLNPLGVNCLRSFPGRGIRLWGARTMSLNPAYRYVNVQRLLLTLVRWTEQFMIDLVHEPNDPLLWGRVRDRLGSYCYDLYQQGALQGTTPDEAFFIKCDAETNPAAVREEGRMVCEVGLAPVVPAEFIVVRITKSVSGTTTNLYTIAS